MSEAIIRAVAEAIRVVIQTMVEAQAERTYDISGHKIGSPDMKQLMFDWNVEDKYSKLKTFWLEVNNVLSTYNTPQTDKLAVVKNLVRKERPPIFRNTDDYGKGNMQHLRRPI